VIQFDGPFLDTFDRVEVRGEDIDAGGRFTRKLAALNDVMSYRLRRPGVVPIAREEVLSVQAIRRDGGLRPSYNSDHYGTDIEIIGHGQPRLYCLMMVLSGAMEMVAGPNGTALAHGPKGMVLRGLAGTRIQTTDHSARLALWIDGARLEHTLAARLDEPLREPLAFSPGIDLSTGPAAAVGRLITHLFAELRDPSGIATDPRALETFTDLLVHCVLNRLDHNYSVRLDRPAGAAVPGHLRRAEAFMHDAADRPIALADVAAAAGCSLGTLQVAFRRFRDATPLAALHHIRLQHVREALLSAGDDEPTRTIARRFGFTNPSRFIAAYGKRFGEHPNETRQLAVR